MDIQVNKIEEAVPKPIDKAVPEQIDESVPKPKGRYGIIIRMIAIALVIGILISATNIDFFLLRYSGTDSMEAASYLLEHTSYLTENRYERLKSLFSNFTAYDMALQAADSAIGKSDYEQAAKYLSRAIAMDDAKDDQAELNMRLGCVYMLDGKLQEAETCFDASIEKAPEQAEAYLLRAQVRVNLSDTVGADQDCLTYIECGGRDPEMLTAAASIAEYAEDYDTAVKITKLQLEDAKTDIQRAHANAEIGRFLYLQGEEAQSGVYLANAKILNSDTLDGVHYAILALSEMNDQQYETAAADFRTAGAKAAEDRGSYYEQAMICAYLMSDTQLLLDISQEAQQAGQMTAQSWMLTGVIEFSRNEYSSGENAITRCIALNQDMAEAYYYRGLCRMQLQDYENAAADFTESIERNELALDCYYNRGLCLFILEQYEQAVTDLAYVIQDGSDQDLAEAAYELLEPLIK